jgi:hypothetical protein
MVRVVFSSVHISLQVEAGGLTVNPREAAAYGQKKPAFA